MLFAGVRPMGEMSKLEYSHIKHGVSITVPSSRTAKRLLTYLPESIWTWIPKKKSGPIPPSWTGLNQSKRRACKRGGFSYPSRWFTTFIRDICLLGQGHGMDNAHNWAFKLSNISKALPK